MIALIKAKRTSGPEGWVIETYGMVLRLCNKRIKTGESL